MGFLFGRNCWRCLVLCATFSYFILQPNPSIPIGESIKSAADNVHVDPTAWMEREREERRDKMMRSKNEIIPAWMADYLEWHKERREQLRRTLPRNNNTEEQSDVKFLVVRCLEREVCGGLSDRLKPMPFYILVASLAERVLLVHWKKPCAIEHFVVPPAGGLDWRVEGTGVTEDMIRNNSNFVNGHANSLSFEMQKWTGAQAGGERLVRARVLNILLDGGQRIAEATDVYNRWRGQPGQRGTSAGAYLGWNASAAVGDHDLFEDVFRLLFEPSPDLQRAIHSRLSRLDLLGESFSAAQVRAKHPKGIPYGAMLEWVRRQNPGKEIAGFGAVREAGKLDMLETLDFEAGGEMEAYLNGLYSNALACADRLAPGLPIYLASDSDFGGRMQNISSLPVRVAPPGNGVRPLHIDSDKHQGRDPSDFYLTFVDVFVMAKATCLSLGGTGFGMLSIRISGNTCEMTHTKTACVTPLDNSTR